MSYAAVPDGTLAAVVTYLEMHAAPANSPPPPSPLTLQPLPPGLDAYRGLFRLVGARWLWFSRLARSDAELAAIIEDPGVDIFAVMDGGEQAGLLELDFRVSGQCELAFVGLVPERAGQGHGRWLLGEALRLAWRQDIHRVHVHTCTLDHPAALAAYCRAGFTPCGRAVETFPDPRLNGLLPRDCAPQVPLLGTDATASPAPASCA